MEKLKSILPLNNQMILRKLGIFCGSYMGNDIYFLVEAINLLISDIGEDFIKKKCEEEGKNWNKMRENLEKANKISSNAKIWYDAINDKKFDKKEVNKVQSMFKKFFIKNVSKISLIQQDLYDLFILLVRNTTIQRNQIPSDAFKIIEHTGFRKIETKVPPHTSHDIK